MSKHDNGNGRGTVLHVTNIPTPYRLPQYRMFRQELARLGTGFVVYFIGKGKRPRYWEFTDDDFEGIEAIHGPAGASIPKRALGITRAIDRMKPEVVVLAWAMDPTALLVLWHCRVRSIPCIVYTGETDLVAAGRSYPGAREAFRKLFLKSADGFVVYGASAAAYLERRGVPGSLVSTAINVVDTGFFRRRVEELRADGAADRERARFTTRDGRPYAMHLLFVGELIELKGLPLLLDALAATGRHDIALHMVGSGPQEQELRAQCERLGLAHDVHFHGYRQKPELPLYYALAEALVFPSLKDVFGLVMVEAAAAGLPVIGSSLSGGTVDVVIPDVTGVVVDPRDRAELAGAIARLAGDRTMRERMGAASKRHALEALTPEKSARGYAEAIARLIKVKR